MFHSTATALLSPARRPSLLLLLAAPACASPLICAPGFGASDAGVCVAVDSGGTAHGADDDDSADPVEVDSPAPWSADDATNAIQAGLDQGLPDPVTLGEAWTDAFDEGGNGACPGSGSYSLIRGVRGCTTTDGWTFAGPADWVDSAEGEGYFLEVDSYIQRPDGTRLAYGGAVSFDLAQVDGTWEWRTTMTGTFQDDRGESWLGAGVSADLLIKGQGQGDTASLLLDGGSSTGGQTVLFEMLDWSPGCGPEGTVATLDGLGRGYRLALSCSSCGTLTLDGESLGEACVDLAAISSLIDRTAGS